MEGHDEATALEKDLCPDTHQQSGKVQNAQLSVVFTLHLFIGCFCSKQHS